MRVRVDQEICTGCALCADLYPDLFELQGDVARAKLDEVPPVRQSDCQDAAEQCPVEAIQFEP